MQSLQQIYHALADVVVGSPVAVEGLAVGLMAGEHCHHALVFYLFVKVANERPDYWKRFSNVFLITPVADASDSCDLSLICAVVTRSFWDVDSLRFSKYLDISLSS